MTRAEARSTWRTACGEARRAATALSQGCLIERNRELLAATDAWERSAVDLRRAYRDTGAAPQHPNPDS